jgi:thiazole synthase
VPPNVPPLSAQTDESDTTAATGPWLTIGPHVFRSRLILGIEQYTSPSLVSAVLRASACDVFITAFDLAQTRSSLPLSDLDNIVGLDGFVMMGTTSFARTQGEALRMARMLRRSCGIDIIKLDVRSADNLPDNAQTVRAARRLIDSGFTVLPLIQPDPVAALTLWDLGCAALRLLAAPVASYRGIVNRREITDVLSVSPGPLIVEGGIGAPSDAAAAIELGASAVLVNTAVAQAPSPPRMAAAMRLAVLAGGMAARPTI